MDAAELAPLVPVTLANGLTSFVKGSVTRSIAALKIAALGGAADVDFALEFTANGPTTIGDNSAAQMLGLWALNSTTGATLLLGILGITVASGGFPVIPILDATHGFSQLVHVPAIYDSLGIGGVFNDVAPSGGAAVTVQIYAVRQFETSGP